MKDYSVTLDTLIDIIYYKNVEIQSLKTELKIAEEKLRNLTEEKEKVEKMLKDKEKASEEIKRIIKEVRNEK